MKNLEFRMKNEGRSISRWLFILHFSFFILHSVLASADKIAVEFKNNQTVQKSNELASNMLRIVNGTTKQLNFYLELNVPSGWNNIRSQNELYRLDAGDSLFIPVKLLFKGREEGDISYMVVAGLLSEATHSQFASATWSLQVKKESDWVASVDKKEAFFINNTDTASFHLLIQNTGNSAEWFTVKFNPHFELKVLTAPDASGAQKEAPPFININLRPGADTVLYYVAKQIQAKSNANENLYNQTPKSTLGNEKYPLRIIVQAQNKDNQPERVWKSTIDFVKSANEASVNEYSRMVLPMTVELNFDNILQDAAIMNLNIYGNANLERSRSLVYRFQSFFTDQYFNEKSFKGNYHYLGYFTQRGNVEVGNITGWGNFGQTPSGVGAKGDYKIGNQKIGLFYIQNPDLFLPASIRSAGINHEITFKTFSLRNYYQHSQNDFYKTESDLAITGTDFRVHHNHIFSLRVGGSDEIHLGAPSRFVTKGMGGLFNYSGTVGRLAMRASTTYGSQYYTGYRGMANFNYGLTYKVDQKYSWTFNNTFTRQNPVYFDVNGVPLRRIHSSTDRYELLYSIRERTSSYSIKGAYYYDDLMTIRYYTRGAGLDYRTTASISGNSSFNVSAFGSYIKLQDYNIPDYFTAQVRTGYRIGALNTNIRYYYGPYEAFEQLQFATYKINHQSIYISTYYGFWLMKNQVSLLPSLNYSYETLYKRSRLSIRPELNYFSANGVKLNFYAEYMLNSQQIYSLSTTSQLNENNDAPKPYTNLLFGLSIKKEFGVPLPGKKFFTTQIVVFKDLNANNKQDKNETGIENTLITIKQVNVDTANDEYAVQQRGQELITDDKGRVTFRNLPAGMYRITATPLVKNADWFPGSEQVVVINKNQEIPISFTHGVRLSGAVLVDHNLASTQNHNPDLSRIRVTALDSAGRVYPCLTDKDGRFELYVPSGQYRVSINQKVIDDKFEMPQSVVAVDLSGTTQSYNVSFHLREKERTVKVKKFNSNGELINDDK